MARMRISSLAFVAVSFLTFTGCKTNISDKPIATQESTPSFASPLKTNASQLQNLISAAWEGDAKRARELLDAGANPDLCDEKLGCPLVAAAYSGSIETVNLLIEKGASINRQDNKGMTALMNAAVNGKIEIVRLLLSQGADPNITAYPVVDGQRTKATAVKLAKGRGYSEIVNLLLQAGARE